MGFLSFCAVFFAFRTYLAFSMAIKTKIFKIKKKIFLRKNFNGIIIMKFLRKKNIFRKNMKEKDKSSKIY